MRRSDTSAEIQEIYDRKIRDLSPEERFQRGLSLTHFCRELCIAGIRDKSPSLDPVEQKQRIFQRIYGKLFSPQEREQIACSLAGVSRRVGILGI